VLGGGEGRVGAQLYLVAVVGAAGPPAELEAADAEPGRFGLGAGGPPEGLRVGEGAAALGGGGDGDAPEVVAGGEAVGEREPGLGQAVLLGDALLEAGVGGELEVVLGGVGDLRPAEGGVSSVTTLPPPAGWGRAARGGRR
jgi:hypothetical protein